MTHHDVIFVGTSPNALAAAARLARAGRSALLLDGRPVIGGPVATEAFAPGFHADTAIQSATLDPEIAAALGITLDVIRRETITSLGPTPATFSPGALLPDTARQAVEIVRALHVTSPPSLPIANGADADALGQLSARLSALGPRPMHEVLRLLFLSARDFCRELGLPDHQQGAIGGAAVRGLAAGPFASGTLFHLLDQLAQGHGLEGGSVRGGLGQLPLALAEKARAAGAEIRAAIPGAMTIEVVDGAATGVRLADGTLLAAAMVISDHDARHTFGRLISPIHLDPELNRTLSQIRQRGSVARVHLALRALPHFTGLSEEGYRGTLVLAPTLAHVERAWDQGKRGAMSTSPYLEVTLPSIADPGLAPAGNHVLSAWVQYVPYGGGERAAVLRGVLGQLARFAPGLPELVLHQEVLLPEDLEARFHLTGGHLWGGEPSLEQSFFLRPFPGSAHYRTPIDNLYLCGSATHPAGYSGRSGWNLAGALLEGSAATRA